MKKDLNTVLALLNSQSGNRAKSKAFLLQQLNVPRAYLDLVMKKLNRAGYVHIFMNNKGNNLAMSSEEWENVIVFKLSSRGKAFLKEGGYQATVHHIEQMKSAVGF